MNYFQRKQAAAKRRAVKVGLPADHPFLHTEDVRAVHGKAWDAPWVVATNGAGQMLLRDGRVMTTEQLMEQSPTYRRALLQRFAPKRRDNPGSKAQRISSAKTSLKQVPMLHRTLAPKGVLGPYNLDLGGGRFDLGTEFLAKHDVSSLVYDPYNRSEQHNRDVLWTVGRIRGVETVTCANVLNVIREASARAAVIEMAKHVLRPRGTAYFWVHEGSKTDRERGARQTGKDSWQNFKPTAWYLREIRKVFPQAYQQGRIIVAPR